MPARTRSQVFDKQQWFLSSQNNEPTHLFHHVPLLSSGNPTLAKASAENGPPTANSGAEATKATWKQTKKQNQRSDRRKIPIISTAAHTTSQALEWFFPLSCYSSKHLQVIACVVELFFFDDVEIPVRHNCSDFVAKMKFIFKFWDDSFEFLNTIWVYSCCLK